MCKRQLLEGTFAGTLYSFSQIATILYSLRSVISTSMRFFLTSSIIPDPKFLSVKWKRNPISKHLISPSIGGDIAPMIWYHVGSWCYCTQNLQLYKTIYDNSPEARVTLYTFVHNLLNSSTSCGNPPKSYFYCYFLSIILLLFWNIMFPLCSPMA